MVASSAFKELSAVLARLESSGSEIRHAAVDEELTGSDGTVTAELSVDVPILPDGDESDGVSITADDATVEDGRVAVDLAVTVSGDAVATAGETPRDASAQSGSDAGSVPAYKDPEALRAAYENHDTFPAMTEALDVDVTSETVRRHMVKYDIHDPEAATPGGPTTGESPRRTPDAHEEAASTESAVDTAADDAASSDTATGDVATGTTAADTVSDDESESERDSTAGSDRVTGSAVTDGGKAALADTARSQSASDPTAVVDLLAERPTEPRADFGLSESVTVGGLTAAINQSRTVHEVAHEIGVSQATAREFLRSFDLINFVTHPLATEQVTVSVDEIRRRLGPAGR
jgi:hypothetical protein